MDCGPTLHVMGGMRVTFFGVRGSTPFSAASHTGFGGNTCCVVIQTGDEAPIILDMGSGLFGYAQQLAGQAIRGTVLLTHLHWDHVAGLPFFSPVLMPGGGIDIYGPPDEGMSLDEALNRLISPPFFPVTMDDFAGDIRIHDFWDGEMTVGSATVRSRPVPHTSATSGYRVEVGGASVVYVPDHQQPIDDPSKVADSVLELCDGADLLIHDGQYPPDLFEKRAHWGHSTPGYAVEVARQAGVQSLALFSHDPMHTDEKLEAIEVDAKERGANAGVPEVFAAREGMTLHLG